ncbi:J-domain-containing protein [Arthrobacter sp. HY1533]|uniref:DnaJ family domain-containing protein n=1 Tax=Arthrobacter sp. HY1533 TaxID=2970919 RepID=UPI0022BA07CC|nr:DUF1992 domain-containing protein [Arthrobacter sp. HY1533]
MPQGKKEPEFRDKALEAARYLDARDAAATPIPADDYANATGRSFGSGDGAQANEPRRIHEAEEVWEVANSAIDAAVARGDFDNLAYAGKPIPGLGGNDDPDWWVKGLLQREQVSGLGPPALMLRKEDAELDATLDAQGSEARVREILADFNARIIEARRQLLGGPPVITKLREVDAEVAAWRSRAVARRAAAAAQAPEPEAAPERGRGLFARLFRRS